MAKADCEAIARRDCKFTMVSDSIQLRQFAANNWPKSGWTRGSGSATIDTVESVFGSRVREGAYHGMYYDACRTR